LLAFSGARAGGESPLLGLGELPKSVWRFSSAQMGILVVFECTGYQVQHKNEETHQSRNRKHERYSYLDMEIESYCGLKAVTALVHPKTARQTSG
jgi:hypothetical protein